MLIRIYIKVHRAVFKLLNFMNYINYDLKYIRYIFIYIYIYYTNQ